MHERKPPQAAHPLIRRRHGRRARRPHANLLLVGGRENWIRIWRRHQLPEAHTEGEQITVRDLPLRGHGIVERPIESLQHLALSQFGEQSVHWLVQPQLAFFHQDHRCNSDDWLGHRGNAEDGVAPHWGAITDRLRPHHINMHLAPPADQRDETRHFTALDIAGHDLVHAAEPRPGQSCGAHYLFPPFCLIGMVLLVFCNHAVHCFQYT